MIAVLCFISCNQTSTIVAFLTHIFIHKLYDVTIGSDIDVEFFVLNSKYIFCITEKTYRVENKIY